MESSWWTPPRTKDTGHPWQRILDRMDINDQGHQTFMTKDTGHPWPRILDSGHPWQRILDIHNQGYWTSVTYQCSLPSQGDSVIITCLTTWLFIVAFSILNSVFGVFYGKTVLSVVGFFSYFLLEDAFRFSEAKTAHHYDSELRPRYSEVNGSHYSWFCVILVQPSWSWHRHFL